MTSMAVEDIIRNVVVILVLSYCHFLLRKRIKRQERNGKALLTGKLQERKVNFGHPPNILVSVQSIL